MKKNRYFRIKRGCAWGGHKMRLVGKSPRHRENVILALLRDYNSGTVQWEAGDTFEFQPDEIREIKA